jgi:hypothetical protein
MSKAALESRLIACIDDLARYKEAVIGKSDLKIGPHTIYQSMDEAERLMLDCLENLRKE